MPLLKHSRGVWDQMHRHVLSDQVVHIGCQEYWGDGGSDRPTTRHKGKGRYHSLCQGIDSKDQNFKEIHEWSRLGSELLQSHGKCHSSLG